MAQVMEFLLRLFWVICLLETPLFFLIPKFRENTKKELKSYFMIMGATVCVIDLIVSLYIYPKILPLLQDTHVINGYGNKNISYFVIVFLIGIILFFLGWKQIKLPIETPTFYKWWVLLIALLVIAMELVIAGAISPIFEIPTDIPRGN